MTVRDFYRKAREFSRMPNHTARRLANKAAALWSRRWRQPRVAGLPSHLMLEVSSACQLRCPLCPLGSGALHRRRQLMTMDTCQRLFHELGPTLYHVNINGMGEPLLNRRVGEMIRLAKGYDIYTDLYTNLQTRETAILHALVDSGLDAVLIAMDGATAPVYEQYRVRGSFSRLLANIETLVAYRARQNATTPEINVQFVAFDHNRHQLQAMQQLVADLGADHLVVKRPFLFWRRSAQEEGRRYVSGQDGINRYQDDGSGLRWQGRAKPFCELLWSSAVVLADGTVAPCCFDYEGKMAFGNVNREPFRRIWNNQRYRAFRTAVCRDWRRVPLCNDDFDGGCPNMYLQPDDWLIKVN